MTEAEIIELLQQGNETAFQHLVEDWKDRIYNTCLGMLQQEEDAEDVTQEVFIVVFRKIGQFREASGMGTWLYRIAVNRCLDLLRKRKRRKWLSEWIDFVHPGVQLEKKQDAALLFQAMNSLPGKQKAAYQLQQLEGLSQMEIAAVLEVSESAVEGLLQRARSGLRMNLKKHFDKNGYHGK